MGTQFEDQNSSISNNSVQHKYSFFCLHAVKDQSSSFQTIQFSRNHLFTFSLNVKQFYLTH